MRKHLFLILLSSVSLIMVLVLAAFMPKYAGMFFPFLEWNITFRTYLQSLLLVMFTSLFFPMATLLLADIARVVKAGILFFLPGKRTKVTAIPRSRFCLISGWIAGSLVFIVMMAGTLCWQYQFKVREQAIALPELPPSFNGFRIVQLSDVHLGSWVEKNELARAVEVINGLNPDAIFFTGDMFNYRTSDGNGFEHILQGLHAPFGIFAIKGNHDYGDYINWKSAKLKSRNMEVLRIFYHNLGWQLLENSHEILKKGVDSITVIGVENWGATRRFQRLGNVDQARLGVEKMAVQLLLSHDPSHWDSIVSKQYPEIDVTFAGHTHGGQIGLEYGSRQWSIVSLFAKRWGGLYENPSGGATQFLYINRGLGNIGYAGRIGIMPEITLIILKTSTPVDQHITSPEKPG